MAERELSEKAKNAQRLQDRMAKLRPVMNMTYTDPLHIPPELIPEGWTYHWVRESIYGQPDTARFTEMSRQGWTPVPADRHPELCYTDTFNRLEHLKGYIYHKGLVLCEIPEEFNKALVERHNAANAKIMMNMPGLENFMGEPTIPVKNNSQAYLTKAVSFKN